VRSFSAVLDSVIILREFSESSWMLAFQEVGASESAC